GRLAQGAVGPAAAPAADGQPGTTDRGDVVRGRRVLRAEAAVAGAGRHCDTGVVVERPEGGVRGVRAAVAVTDRIGAHGRGTVHRGAEVGQRVRGRLDQQDVAVRADRRDHVQVQGDLLGPTGVTAWVVRAAVLVNLAEAPVGGGTRRQAELAAVHGQVRLGVRV